MSGAIELAPAVRMFPVRTPTLPPATHTNLFVVGERDALLIEPASPYPDELERISNWINALGHEGIVIRAILLTHHHVDHVGGAMALRERLDVPIAAHSETWARLGSEVPIERTIADEERIEIDETLALRAIHTPGHAPGHLCFLEERSRVLIAGDMVAGTGTILIDPTDGDMTQYLASLERMKTFDASMLAPAHGDVLSAPNEVLDRYRAHRLMREQKVLDALARHDRPTSIEALLPDAYADTPQAIWPLARLSIEAHLIKLEREGRATREPSGWRLAH